jgi:stress-induced morphogen
MQAHLELRIASDLGTKLERVLKSAFPHAFCSVRPAGFQDRVCIVVVGKEFRGLPETAKLQKVLSALSGPLERSQITQDDVNRVASVVVYSDSELG